MDELAQIFGEAVNPSKPVAESEVSAMSPSLSSDIAEAAADVDAERGVETPTTEPMSRLAAYVMREFQFNSDHRRSAGVDERLRKCILAQTCNYSDEQKDKMRRAGISPDIYAPITNTKIRAAKALLGDIFQNSADNPYTLKPTPDPELPKELEEQVFQDVAKDVRSIYAKLQGMGVEQLPPEAQQTLVMIMQNAISSRYGEMARRRQDVARERAKRMEEKVHDILAEGGWTDAFQDYVNNICVYGTGIVLGPIPRVVACNGFKKDRKSGVSKYVRQYKEIPTFESVNPFDVYPAPNARTVEDGPLCIRIRYSASELWRYIQNASSKSDGVASGWIPGTVNSLLSKNPNGGVKMSFEPSDAARRYAEKDGADNFHDCTFEGVRCFSTVRGSELLEIGVLKNRDGKAVKQAEYYQIETIVIDGFVVYVRILDERVGRPVAKGVFYECPGSWWGESIAEKLAMVQNVMNNCVKALLTNMAAASGPMYWINDVSRLSDKDVGGLKIKPHKMWAFQSSMMGSQGAPMGIIQVPSNASELLAIFDRMKMQADDDSGIPAYTYGQAQGAGAAMRTAQGLSIFTEAASRGMRMVIMTTDRLVIRSIVKKVANYVLVNDDNMDIKGDCEVVATGIMGKILRAQQDQERIQHLSLVLNSQMLTQICGVKGIMALFRPSLNDIGVNADEVLPSAERVKELETIQEIMQVAQAQQAQAQAQNAQVQGGMDQRQQQLDQQQQQMQMQQQQQEMQAQPQGGVAQRRGVA